MGRTAAVIDCVRLGLKGVHAKNQDSRNPAPARTPLFPSSILDRMNLLPRDRLFSMKPLLRLGTSIGDTFERNWATCQQLADVGTQSDPTRVETPLNWPVESAGNSVDGPPLARTQSVIWKQVVKAAATNLDLRIRNLPPDNPVQMAWVNADRNSNMLANVIPTEQYKLTNNEFYCATSTCLGIPNPVCIPT